jgi:hypothetical protein
MIGKIAIIAILGVMLTSIMGAPLNASAHGYYHGSYTHYGDNGYGHAQYTYVKHDDTQGSYDRGYNDAICDSQYCNGHGYNAHCPPDVNCNWYTAGYDTAWYNNVDTNTATAAIGGNKINGDHNTINQQIIQQQGPRASSTSNGDNSDGGDNSGQLPRCKAFCLGVQ